MSLKLSSLYVLDLFLSNNLIRTSLLGNYVITDIILKFQNVVVTTVKNIEWFKRYN